MLDNIILTTAENFPDALTGSVLASKLHAPILLICDDEVKNKLTMNFIQANLNVKGTIYILGGSGVVKPYIEDSIKSVSSGKIVRLGGINREATANLVDETIGVVKGTPLCIVTGDNYPDALSISSIAGINQYPIVLSKKDSLSEDSKNYIASISPKKIFIIGGMGVLSSSVETELKGLGVSEIVRISGSNRYETSINIAKYFNLNTSKAVLATGNDFPDALSGSILASKLNAPIILTDGSSITSQREYLDSTGINDITIFGGLGAVSGNIERVLTGLTPLEELSEADIQRLQSYEQYMSVNESVPIDPQYESFDKMYTDERANCDGLLKKFSPLTLADYSQAKTNWLVSPRLVYYSAIGQFCVRGILGLTYYDVNKFNLTPNQKYERDVEYRLRNSVTNGKITLKLESIHYLSEFKAVN